MPATPWVAASYWTPLSVRSGPDTVTAWGVCCWTFTSSFESASPRWCTFSCKCLACTDPITTEKCMVWVHVLDANHMTSNAGVFMGAVSDKADQIWIMDMHVSLLCLPLSNSVFSVFWPVLPLYFSVILSSSPLVQINLSIFFNLCMMDPPRLTSACSYQHDGPALYQLTFSSSGLIINFRNRLKYFSHFKMYYLNRVTMHEICNEWI